jgi:CHAD domain-containing protein
VLRGGSGAAVGTSRSIPTPDRHVLRKVLKKLRYGIDEPRAELSRHAAKSRLRTCKAVQQTLGERNDVVTAVALADQLGEGMRPDPAPAIGALADLLDRSRDDRVHDLDKQWKAFRKEPHFWGRRSAARLGTALSGRGWVGMAASAAD